MNGHRIAYAAIRWSDDGHEWLDISTVHWDEQYSRSLAERDDAEIPQWAKANRVVRIAQVELREVK